jgi:hypothetical protein
MKVLAGKRRYNLETCLMCLDCVKAFDRVIKTNYLKYCQGKIISYLLLKIVIEFHAGNKSKYKQ